VGNKPRLALVIGHTHGQAEGARNRTTGLTEWTFNKVLASAVQLEAPDEWDLRVFERPVVGGIPAVVRQVNAFGPLVAVSLHANAALAPTATGTEALYWYRSRYGKALAEEATVRLAEAVGLRSRGAKPISYRQRGWFFLYHTSCPAIIAEPFFISNDNDLRQALTNIPRLARTFVYLFEFALHLFK